MFPYLDVLIFLPALAGVVIVLIDQDAAKNSVSRTAKAVVLVELLLAIVIAFRFRVGVGGFQMNSSFAWMPTFGISWRVGIDGISLLLVLLTTLLFAIALFAASEAREKKGFVAWMLLLETACLGSFLSLDVLLFFLFFELTLVPTYFLIGNWGMEQRGRAAIKFFVYTFLGSAFMLIGILSLVAIHQSQTGTMTFSLVQLAHTSFSPTTEKLLFLAFTAAFVVKAPLFPFHTWSPDAYSQAPIGGVVILAGVMAKLGTYGIIRFDFQLFPGASQSLAWLMLTLATAGIVYGAIVASGENDLRKLVAYSSLAHMGFIVLGLFAFSAQGLSGSVLQMFNHGIYTAALFLLLGMIYKRRNTYDADKLSGLQSKAPVMAAIFTVVMMASIGLPGLNGFVGEFLILIGTFVTHRWWAVVGTTGVVLSAIYLLWAYQRVFHRKDTENRPFAEISRNEIFALVPLVTLIVVLGVYPRPFLDRINPSVNHLLSSIQLAPTNVYHGAASKGVGK